MINNLSDLNEQLDLFFNHLNEEKIQIEDKILHFDVDQTTINKLKKNVHYHYRWTEERDDKSLVKIEIDCTHTNENMVIFILEEMNKLIIERVSLFYRSNKDYLIVIQSDNFDDNEILKTFNNLIVFCENNKIACKIFNKTKMSVIQIFVNAYWVK